MTRAKAASAPIIGSLAVTLSGRSAAGYFGCRAADGSFDPVRFAEQASDPQVKMIELKLSQGAKPGHGGILPAQKVSAEISATRGVPMGADCDHDCRYPECGSANSIQCSTWA